MCLSTDTGFIPGVKSTNKYGASYGHIMCRSRGGGSAGTGGIHRYIHTYIHTVMIHTYMHTYIHTHIYCAACRGYT
jgi:hypothetical protein